MARTILLGSPVRCTDSSGGVFSRPRVSGIVMAADAPQLEYLIVHRGLLGGHDQVVPIGDIAESSSEEVMLNISYDELKALPDLEIKVPGHEHAERSIPTHSVVLSRSTSVADDAGQVLGHLSGVVMDSARQVEQILLDRADTGIPVEQISAGTEERLQIRPAVISAAPQSAGAQPQAAGTRPQPITARDPVCGMDVDPAVAPMVEYRGQLYYFCPVACKQTFEASPAEYAMLDRTA
jgi:YHS domain-containing protein